MKKLLAVSSVLCVTLGSIQLAAFADNDWFDRYDHKHAGRWNYGAFHRAEVDWHRAHPDEHRWSDRELHARFREMDRDHDGWLHREDVREWHHWQ